MGTEDESVGQATAARRERLRALRTAQELLSTPDENSAAAAADATVDHALTESGGEGGQLGDLRESDGKREHMVTDEDTVSQAVAARHERLRALKAAKEILSTPDNGSVQTGSDVKTSEDVEEEKMSVKFRNYLPRDKQLQEHKLAPPVLPKFEDPVAAVPAPEKIEDPFVNIAPKKPNWDLRRDVQKKLDKLERRTQKALYQLYLEQEAEREALENREAGAED